MGDSGDSHNGDNLRYRERNLGAHVLRRLSHIALSSALVFYLVPYTLWGYPRIYFMLAILVGIPSVVEFLRLRANALVYGLRDNERNTLASYYWYIIGVAVLLALFPQSIAIPVIAAVAFGDPVVGETRRLRRRYWVTIGILVCSIPFALYGYPLTMALLAGVFVFGAESIGLDIQWYVRDSVFRSRSRGTTSPLVNRFRLAFHFDDDFIMQLLPAVLLLLIFINYPSAFPDRSLTPIIQSWP